MKIAALPCYVALAVSQKVQSPRTQGVRKGDGADFGCVSASSMGACPALATGASRAAGKAPAAASALEAETMPSPAPGTSRSANPPPQMPR